MENELELKWRRIQQAMRQEEADGCLLTMNMNFSDGFRCGKNDFIGREYN